MSPSVPAAVFASYLLGESPEHLINAGAEQVLDKVHHTHRYCSMRQTTGQGC